MRNQIRQKLNRIQRALLASTAALAIVGSLAIGLINAPKIRAQTQSSEHYAFEVASVRPHKPGDTQFAGPQVLPGGRFISRTILMVDIAFAYDIPLRLQGDSLIIGGPGWIGPGSFDDVYDIEATVSKQAIPDGLSINDATNRERLMVQALLADRFKLAVHREMKEMPVYALTVAKGGPKLVKADIEEKDCPTPPPGGGGDGNKFCHRFNGGRGRGMQARAVTVSDMAAWAGNWADRPIVDKTGLKGLYHIETDPWASMELGATAPPPGTKQDGVDVSDLPTLFTIFDRLGLKMEAQRDKVSILVIDHIERPSEN
ncbi:MAG TPA: TIGR03435 family protein [Bryobacteraceae bacterium]